MNEATLVDVFVDPRRSFPLGQASSHQSSLLIKNEDLKPLSPEERKLLGEYVYEQRDKYKNPKSFIPITVDSLSVTALVAALLRRQNKVKLSWPFILPMEFKGVEMQVAAAMTQPPPEEHFAPTKKGYYWRRERSWPTGEWLMTHVYKGDDGLVFDGLWVSKIPSTHFDGWDWAPVQDLPCDQTEPSGDGYYWREVAGVKRLREMKKVDGKWYLRSAEARLDAWGEDPWFNDYRMSARIPNPAESTSPPQKVDHYPPMRGYNWFKVKNNYRWIPAWVEKGQFCTTLHPWASIEETSPWQWGGPLPSGPTA